jgi:hypothetical protein
MKNSTEEKKEDVQFGEQRNSKWQDWQDCKKRPNFNSYKRSFSKPGMWKNSSGDYRRVPSRTPSRRPFPRSSSRPFLRAPSRPF